VFSENPTACLIFETSLPWYVPEGKLGLGEKKKREEGKRKE